MSEDLDVNEVAATLRVSIGLFLRRLRQAPAQDDLTMPEVSVLARLERAGPATSAALARLEQISPQGMGGTLAGLEARGLVQRHPDPEDGRRVLMSVTGTGSKALWNKRNARTEHLAAALSAEFTPSEIEQLMAAAPLIERLAQRI
jgi:DNA-binding MarR family transcriptional regulator